LAEHQPLFFNLSKNASQSLRPQAQKKWNHFFGGVYLEKILLGLQMYEHSECAAAGRSFLKGKPSAAGFL
jgi:hypothetical protein